MTSIKRSLLETPPPASDPASGPDNSIIKRSPGKKQKSPGGSPRGSKADKAGGEDGKKSVHRAWTPEDEVVFLEMIEAVAREHLWAKIKQDGRLEYRGNPGVRAHLIAVMNKLKK